MIEHTIQLVDRVRPKRITHLGAVERDPHRRIVDMAVIGDIGEIGESVDGPPRSGVKGVGAQCLPVVSAGAFGLVQIKCDRF